MVIFNDLNENQKKAVVDDSDHLRIIAGAGSGKTRVLTMRIAYLIEEKDVPPYQILAITFTNKAANEMKSRIQEMLQEKGTGTWISTIHSLCVRILSEDIEALGYPRNFTICDSDDQKTILKEAYKEYGLEKGTYPYGQMLDYISANKSERVSPEQARELAHGDEQIVLKAKVYEYYVKRLASVYGLDFDDLILWVIRLFEEFPTILTKWSRRFHYVLVDEFQDIDRDQYRLIRYLCKEHDHLYVVGDPDQTIYTWRGADVNIITNFDRDFPNTKTIILDRNYRSTNNILSGANSLIANNRMRVKKDLYSENGDGDKILHKSLETEEGEAYYIASEILQMHQQGKKYNDIAVLYRSNYLSRTVEKVFVENHIPYVIYGGIRFYERAEVKDMLSYLRMILTGDDLSFSRIVNVPKRGIGTTTLDRIREIAFESDMTMYEVVKSGLYSKNKAAFDNFVRMVEHWRSELPNIALDDLFQHVLDESGYREMLEKDKETERLENIKALLDDIETYTKTYPDSDLNEYLQMIALYTDKATEKNSDSVNLLTIHSAKGLEFDTVFVIGLSEGIFPSERTMAEGMKGLEEERRLAYVAYTRAKKKLYLTENRAFSYVVQSGKLPSRFIKEIDPQYVLDLNEPKKKSFFFEGAEEFTQKKPVSSDQAKADSQAALKKGDLVEHAVFKSGVVISIENNIATIAFAYPYGVKKIMATHPSIHKKVSKA
ncbi:MAG: UvrD-helicase domain-containing protein [Erysipelotrichaceae bacterium]|nr:UvrD-helicase domain-containing protein [Erysipelotrichaceae bacterium]